MSELQKLFTENLPPFWGAVLGSLALVLIVLPQLLSIINSIQNWRAQAWQLADDKRRLELLKLICDIETTRQKNDLPKELFPEWYLKLKNENNSDSDSHLLPPTAAPPPSPKETSWGWLEKLYSFNIWLGRIVVSLIVLPVILIFLFSITGLITFAFISDMDLWPRIGAACFCLGFSLASGVFLWKISRQDQVLMKNNV